METLTIYPKTKEQSTAVKAVLNALKIDFKSEKGSYHPKFVAKIIQGRKDLENGKGIKIATDDLWK